MKLLSLQIMALILLLSAGCRSKEHDDLPEVKPLPQENVKISMQLDISDNRPAPAVKTIAPEQAAVPAVPAKKAAVKKTRKAEKKSVPVRRRTAVPPPAGAIDSELNSVEKRYVQSVRERNRSAASASEAQVFGAFQMKNIFSSPQKEQ